MYVSGCVIGPQYEMYFLLWIVLKSLNVTSLLYKGIDELYNPLHNPLNISFIFKSFDTY